MIKSLFLIENSLTKSGLNFLKIKQIASIEVVINVLTTNTKLSSFRAWENNNYLLTISTY